MNNITPDFLLQLVVVIATAGSVYGAIKGDLRVMHEKIKAQADRISRLENTHHRRVDDDI